MQRPLTAAFAGIALLLACSCTGLRPAAGNDTVSQTSTITALLEGCYDGVTTCGELKAQGDFGIGTFDRLDGEMILLDGTVYQARADGTVVRPADSARVPFASVTRFGTPPMKAFGVCGDLDALKAMLDALRTGGDNLFYAIRVEGVFERVKFRSVPAQSKPYPKLAEVAARQPVFEKTSIRGTLVGFWCPAYAKTLNLAGYHLHFISEDRKSGGHLLDCVLRSGGAVVEARHVFHMTLPQDGAFRDARIGGDAAADRALKAAESGR
jgi:acetolactate decarboxylase